MSRAQFGKVFRDPADQFDVAVRGDEVGGGDDHAFRNYLSAARISHDVYTPNAGDNYSLPGLATLLARKSKLELVMEIMDTPLLKRKPFRK